MQTVKQKAPKKQLLNSSLRTFKDIEYKLDWYIGKAIDWDKKYGEQCMDVAVDYVWWLTSKGGNPYHLAGNAKDAIDPNKNKLPSMFTVHINTPDFLPKKGDIFVGTKSPYSPEYGHIGLVYGDITLQSMTVLEQNYDGDGVGPCILRKDYYRGITHFIRPAYI